MSYAPVIPWNKARSYFVRNWRQSEHFAVLGMNGSGKSYLMNELSAIRFVTYHGYVAVFISKPKDNTLDYYTKKLRFKRLANPAKHDFLNPPRGVIIRPNSETLAALRASQQKQFSVAIDRIWRAGGWAMVLDEIRYLSQFLKMQELVQALYTQARSSDITLISSTQRPRFAPLEMYTESRHFAFFHDREKQNLDRISEIASHVDKDKLITDIRALEKYHFLYVNSDNGETFISKVIN